MSLLSTHPRFDEFLQKWEKLDHVFAGQDKIKELREEYLKPLPSMILDGMQVKELGWERYEQYIARANFPDDFSEAVRNNHGLLWSKPAIINLPSGMAYLNDKATRNGMSLVALLSLINEIQLRNGRIGLLLDMPSVRSPENKPFISVYYAKDIRNWDTADVSDKPVIERDALNMVILDESRMVRDPDDFNWKLEQRYRLLSLGQIATNDQEGAAEYKQALFIGDTYDESSLIAPQYMGKKLEEIPFITINASDCMIDPDVPPLLGLANICLSMYVSDADYRQHLYMQSQDTLLIKGALITQQEGSVPTRVGAHARIDVGPEGDAKYVGVNSSGLEEQRLALANDKTEAQFKAGQMVANTKGSQESGEALRIRIGARTASLVQLAKTGANGLEMILKICAKWMGENENEVKVSPNLDFSKALFSGQNLVQTMAAKNLGAPISYASIHDHMADQGVTSLTFEEEILAIEKEYKNYPFLRPVGTADQNPTQQVQGASVETGGAGQQSQK